MNVTIEPEPTTNSADFDPIFDEQPGIGAILKELWELEREAFFKDQRKA